MLKASEKLIMLGVVGWLQSYLDALDEIGSRRGFSQCSQGLQPAEIYIALRDLM
jgi:hypothetical protein